MQSLLYISLWTSVNISIALALSGRVYIFAAGHLCSCVAAVCQSWTERPLWGPSKAQWGVDSTNLNSAQCTAIVKRWFRQSLPLARHCNSTDLLLFHKIRLQLCEAWSPPVQYVCTIHEEQALPVSSPSLLLPRAQGSRPQSVYYRPAAGGGICVKTAKNMEMCPSANYAQEDMIFLPRIGMLPKLGNRGGVAKKPSYGREGGEQVKEK